METCEILIVTRSVVLQQGLGALLESLPEVATVKAIGDLTGTYEWIETHQPKVIMLDLVLSGKDPRAALEKIHSLSPDTQRVLLADDVHEMNWIPQYAEAILVKGALPSAVLSIVTNLLSAKGEENVQ